VLLLHTAPPQGQGGQWQQSVGMTAWDWPFPQGYKEKMVLERGQGDAPRGEEGTHSHRSSHNCVSTCEGLLELTERHHVRREL
jgi:hypothetical protein